MKSTTAPMAFIMKTRELGAGRGRNEEDNDSNSENRARLIDPIADLVDEGYVS
jgi:hypothetical protein